MCPFNNPPCSPHPTLTRIINWGIFTHLFLNQNFFTQSTTHALHIHLIYMIACRLGVRLHIVNYVKFFYKWPTQLCFVRLWHSFLSLSKSNKWAKQAGIIANIILSLLSQEICKLFAGLSYVRVVGGRERNLLALWGVWRVRIGTSRQVTQSGENHRHSHMSGRY